MKKLLLLLMFSATVHAKQEIYYIAQGTLLCPESIAMKRLYNYLVRNNFSYDRNLVHRSSCYPVNQHRFATVVGVDGDFLQVSYQRYDSNVVLTHWTYKGFIGKWSDYQSSMVTL